MTPDALDKTIAALYEREVAYGEALDAYSEAKAAYETAYAEAFLNAVGAVEERKQTAVLACRRQSLALIRAEAVKAFTKVKLEDCQQVLSARQSQLSAEVKIHGAAARVGA